MSNVMINGVMRPVFETTIPGLAIAWDGVNSWYLTKRDEIDPITETHWGFFCNPDDDDCAALDQLIGRLRGNGV